MKRLPNHVQPVGGASACGTPAVASAIADLAAGDAETRAKAHQALVAIGQPAARCLVEAMANPSNRVRWEAGRILGKLKVDWSRFADEATVRALVADLGSKDGLVRVRARRALVTIGPRTIKALVDAISGRSTEKRWEAVKALGEIGDPEATEALVRALDDSVFDVRWLAAEGLVSIGRSAFAPLLEALVDYPKSIQLREGAHHVLHGTEMGTLKSILMPVLNALEDPAAALATPLAASKALESLAQALPRGTKRRTH
jgi:HEAT repeat protein